MERSEKGGKMMRKSTTAGMILGAFISLLTVSCATTSGDPKGMVRIPQVQNYWAAHYEVIKAMTTATLYTVSHNTEDEGIQYNLTEVRVLEAEETESLSQLLQKDSSYLFNVAKKTPFVPQYVLGIGQGETLVMVFVMPEAAMLAYQKDGRMVIEDYDPISEALDKILLKN